MLNTDKPVKPYPVDGSIYSQDYATGRKIRFGQWSVAVNGLGAYESAIALVQSTVTGDDIARMLRIARHDIRASMKARGELGKGYRIKLAWQVDVDTTYPRTVIVFRAWEI